MDLYRPVLPYLSLIWPVKPKELPTPALDYDRHKKGFLQLTESHFEKFITSLSSQKLLKNNQLTPLT
jgi:hypothetical protein